MRRRLFMGRKTGDGERLLMRWQLLAALVALAAVLGCGPIDRLVSSVRSPEPLALLVGDFDVLLALDVESMSQQGVPRPVLEALLWLGGPGGPITAERLAYGHPANSGGDGLWAVQGEFELEDYRDYLEESGFADGAYRGYELWESGNDSSAYSMIEDWNIVLAGDAPLVKEALREVNRGEGRRFDAEATLSGAALEKAGEGWISRASENHCARFAVRGCEAVGWTLRGGREGYLLEIRWAFLFATERRAKTSVNAIEDHLDNLPFAESAQVEADGEFVVAQTIIDEDDFGRLLDDLNLN